MLIKKPTRPPEEDRFTELQKMALAFLPPEQVRKFHDFPELLEEELQNEAREPEMNNVLKDLFNALHEHNTPKLLKVLQGDKKKLFYAFRKQLMEKPTLTKREATIIDLIGDGEFSLLTISLIK